MQDGDQTQQDSSNQGTQAGGQEASPSSVPERVTIVSDATQVKSLNDDTIGIGSRPTKGKE